MKAPFCALVTGVLALAALVPDSSIHGRAPTARDRVLAYVSNEVAKSVSVIDVAANRVVRTIQVAGRPRGIAARDGRIYVALSDTDRQAQGEQDAIVVLDAGSGNEVARYNAGSDPEQFVLSHDGRRLYAANEDAGTATATDTRTHEILATLVVGIEPEGVAISPDGRWVYVTAETSNTVSVIDTKQLKIVSSFLVDPRPRAAAFLPDGSLAFVTSEIGGSVNVVDGRKHQVVRRIRLPGTAHPVGVVSSPDGALVYVANGHGNSVSIIDRATSQVVDVVAAGRRPWGLALTPDGKTLYTANGLSGDVTVIDTATRKATGSIATGEGAWGVAIDAGTRP